MKDIKVVRKALGRLDNQTKSYIDNGYSNGYIHCEEIKVLDQFINDTEEMIKKYEELKIQYEHSQNANKMQDQYITKLEKENKKLKKELKEEQKLSIYKEKVLCKKINNYIEKIKCIEKQLAISNKALNKACERLIQKSDYYKGCKIEEVKEDILHDID